MWSKKRKEVTISRVSLCLYLLHTNLVLIVLRFLSSVERPLEQELPDMVGVVEPAQERLTSVTGS